MVYIRNGAVEEKRSPWRPSIIADFFLALLNLLVIFFRTIFDPAAAAGMRPPGGGGSNKKGGGGGGGGGGKGRIVGMDNLNADHTARCGGGG